MADVKKIATRDSYGKAFNEWDYNVHYGKTFWFDDNDTWGLDYRASVVWYYYPHGRGHDHNTHGKSHFQYGHDTMTTMDFNHSLALLNPYLVPFVDFVHEYHENNADLIQLFSWYSWIASRRRAGRRRTTAAWPR